MAAAAAVVAAAKKESRLSGILFLNQRERWVLTLISIKTYGYVSRYIDGKEIDYYDFESGTSVKDILKKLNIPDSAVGFVSVNGSMVDINYPVTQGDQIKIYPVVMGG